MNSKALRLTVGTLFLTISFATGGMFGFTLLVKGFLFGGAICASAIAGVSAIYKTKFSFFKLLAGWMLAGLISIIVALILFFLTVGLINAPLDTSPNSDWIETLSVMLDCAIGGAIGGFIGVASIAWSLGTDTTKRTYLLVWTIAGALGGSIGIIASFSLTTDFFDFGWASGGIIGGAIFGLIGAIVLLRDLENQRQTAEAQNQV